MRAITWLSMTIITLGAGQAALAAGKQARERVTSDVAAKEREAKKACLASDAAKGVEILAELYVDTNNLTYIFNQGRCFEQNSKYQDALGRFREYLLKGETQLSDEDKAVAKRHIENCESYLPKNELRSPVVATPEPTPAVPVLQPQPIQTAAEPPVVAVTQQPRAADAKPGSGLRIAGITVGSLGAAAVISGVILNAKANSMASDLEKPDNFNRDVDSTRKDYKTFAWASYGVGAGCLAVGSLLYYLGWRRGLDQGATVALVPNLRGDMAGVIVEGAF